MSKEQRWVALQRSFIGGARYVRLFPTEGRPTGSVWDIVDAGMKRVIDTSEVLGTVETPQGTCEVCASAEAGYDESAGRLLVKLEAFLRPAGLLVKERHFRADWLPANETISESGGRDESSEMAREIFHRWVGKVRKAAPALHSV